ncbi:hypothetical protein EZV62_009199 [Acer yangbiense]|uniref:Reverse transcriptase zinc-binding domain-containing protein n=1 Tax=Acer yangbiense TaxID=1000413 RepID=A0A5C7IG10_9ROSI|nr:hypothetical protein EZV62_009199 [Acer yangbiense]
MGSPLVNAQPKSVCLSNEGIGPTKVCEMSSNQKVKSGPFGAKWKKAARLGQVGSDSPFVGVTSGKKHSSFAEDVFIGVEAILSLPLSRFQTGDSLLWHFDKSGNYSVRSGYKLKKLIQSSVETFGSFDVDWWKSIWCLKIPLKVSVFVWKACRNWLPTLFNLERRGVHTRGLCPYCSKRPETTVHTLWGCDWIRKSRSNCSFLVGLKWNDIMNFHDLFIYAGHVLYSKELECLCVVWWRIWFWRNQKIHTSSNFRVEHIFAWASNFLDKFRGASVSRPPISHSSSVSPDSVVKWAPPPTGSFKINSDAAVRVDSQLIGVGIVVKDSCGRVCASSVNRINACSSPSVVEAIAIRNGIRLAGDTDLLPAVLESDAKWVVDLINSNDDICADIGSIISEIVALSNCL